MGLIVTPLSDHDTGLNQVIQAEVTFDSSYREAGEPLNAADLRFRLGSRIDSVQFNPLGDRRVSYVPDPTLPDRGLVKIHGDAGDDFLLKRANLSIGTVSAATVKHGTLVGVHAGVTAERAGAEVAFTAGGAHDIAPDANLIQEAFYRLSLNAAGVVTITKGATAGDGLAVPPALPAGEAPLGLVLVKVAAGATLFDATTDDLDAAHLTTTFDDSDQAPVEGTDLSGLTVRCTVIGR